MKFKSIKLDTESTFQLAYPDWLNEDNRYNAEVFIKEIWCVLKSLAIRFKPKSVITGRERTFCRNCILNIFVFSTCLARAALRANTVTTHDCSEGK